VKKCLAKDPGARWQTARDLKDELEWIAGGSATSPAVAARARNKNHFAWALAWLIAMIGAFLAFRYLHKPPPAVRLVRFSISPPEKVAFSDPLAISPDGTRLALIASVSGGEPSLWVRRLDSLTAQPLLGTEGVTGAFWSPDGQFIAFFAKGKLKKVEISAGLVQNLCDAQETDSGTWNSEGVIIFTLNSVLYRVAAEGGSERAVTHLNESNDELAHAWPYFLPDGRHFLYTTISRGHHEAVYIGTLGSKETKRLFDSRWKAVYAPSSEGSEGHLLSIRNGNLMAQRFDPTRLQLAGEPVLLAEKVADFGHDAYFTVAANGTLAYRSAGVDKTQLMWFDRAGKKLGTVGLPMQDIHGAISPDGKRVAVSRSDSPSTNSRALIPGPSQSNDIWVLDLERGTASRLTFDAASDLPVWSPDGRHIAYASSRNGHMDLYEKAANGATGEELLVKSDEDKHPFDFSRDGQFLAYASASPKTNFDLWVLPLKRARKPFPLLQTQFGEGVGHFSPDGRWMAYQSTESGEWAVYVRPFGSSEADGNRTSEGRWRISTGAGFWPNWRADGKELFFLAPDDSIMAVAVKPGGSKAQPAFEAYVPKPLFKVRVYGMVPFAVTADGQRFLVNTQIGEEKSPSVTVLLNWPTLLNHSAR
jgi:eukaryotic-like serine/threonine-protein kinase